MLKEKAEPAPLLPASKFADPDFTAKGEPRASVQLKSLDTLWFCTGTICNITCTHCYIESSPKNDRLVYLTREDVRRFLIEIKELDLPTKEIGFTGGEPFINPHFPDILSDCLQAGFEVLVLTNAMKPLMRKRVMNFIQSLPKAYRNQLRFRVSLDHYMAERHDLERGKGSFEIAAKGIDWLIKEGFAVAIAGRTFWGEEETKVRDQFQALFDQRGWHNNANDPSSLVLFPEMDDTLDIAEITTSCWGILDLSPDTMMCATSRMVVKRKGESLAKVVPCTLLPYDPKFEMGETLAQSLKANGDMFLDGAVKLCHPHCARFCVLGGGSCSPD